MVLKYSISGSPYRAPPYSEAEIEEFERSLSGDLVRYIVDVRARQRQRQEMQEARQEDIPPERKQP